MRSITRGNHGPLSSLSKLADGIRANTDMNRAASLSRGPNLGSKMNAAPWSNTWPAPGATLDLDFANDRGFVRGVGQGKSLGGVTFTRASNAQYIDSTGVLQTAANNVARYEWASTTQTGAGTPASPYVIPLQANPTCNGLLIEESRTNRALWCRDAASGTGTNMLTYSGNINATNWAAEQGGVTTDSTLAPDGGTLAAKYTENTLAGVHGFRNTVGISIYGNNTASIYLKNGNRRYVAISLYEGTAYTKGAVIDLQAGVLTQTYGTYSIAPTITAIGSGWYRFSITDTITANSYFYICGCDSATPLTTSGRQNRTGDGTSYFYAWGAQLTPLPFTTDYQATTSTALYGWSKSNVTVTKDQTGIDGVANSATSITASASNAVLIQPVALASGSRTSSIYLKRLTGTGTIQVTLDGSTWSTVDLSNGLWSRIVLSGTVTNPAIGVQITTSGDAVAMDFAQIEDGDFVTSPILTTSATATRSADLLSISGANFAFFSQQNETLLAVFNASQVSNAPILVGNSGGVGNLLLTSAGLGSQNNGSSALNAANAYTTISVGKLAVTGNASRRSVSLNGSIVSSNTSVRTTATVANMYLGSNGTAYMNGTLSRIIYFPKAFSDSTLQNLTGKEA